MFTLRGPEFLALFLGLVLLVYVVVDYLIAAYEARLPSDTRIRDPYAIAYLRGEARELLRVVAMSLVLRRLLGVEGKVFLTIDAAEIERVQVPVEKQILEACQKPYSAPGLLAHPGFVAAAEKYRLDLMARGLIADEGVKHQRWLYIFVGIACLLVIAVTKIVVALSTGHSNVFFLVILAILSTLLLAARAVSYRTLAGKTALSNLRSLFDSLWRARRGGKTFEPTEAALLAAVFGVYTLGAFDSIAWARMFPRAGSNSNSCGGGGSSCGGGGGGGGGCGGGGGGCGGCGS